MDKDSLFKRNYLSVILIIIIAAISYSQTFRYDFCYDDYKLIVNRTQDYEHPRIFSLMFKAPFWGYSPTRKSNYYRPMVTLTYWLNYKLFYLKPGYYHAFNVALHTLNGLLLFFILTLISKRKDISFWISSLFLAHPIHMASVVWIAGRTDLCALMFLLLSYLSLTIERISLKQWYWPLSFLVGVFYLGALLSKEVSLLFPLIMLLSDTCIFSPKEMGSKKWSMITPYVFSGLALLFYFTLRSHVLGVSIPSALFKQAISLEAFFHIPSIFTYYLKVMLVPVVYYLHPLWVIPSTFKEISTWINGIIFLGLLSAFLFSRHLSIRMGIALIATFIMPVLYTFLEDNPVNEHWAYLPSLGFAIILGAFVVYLNRWKRGGFRIGTILGCVLLIIYILLLWTRNTHFKNNFTLYSDGIKKRPDMTLYYINLGDVYERMGKREHAKALFKKALDIDPLMEGANSNLGILCAKEGNYKKAIEYFEQELKLNPNSTSTLMNEGRAYLMINQLGMALKSYEKALSLDQRIIPVELNKAAVELYDRSNPSPAIALWECIIKYSPSFSEVYISLGAAYANRGNYQKAVVIWNRFISLFQDHTEVTKVKAWIKDVEEKVMKP